MRIFLLGGQPHQRGISRILYLTNLSSSSLSHFVQRGAAIYIAMLR